jgi:hypothetical protein
VVHPGHFSKTKVEYFVVNSYKLEKEPERNFVRFGQISSLRTLTLPLLLSHSWYDHQPFMRHHKIGGKKSPCLLTIFSPKDPPIYAGSTIQDIYSVR